MTGRAAFQQRVRERALHVQVAAEGELARTFDGVFLVSRDAASTCVEIVDDDGSHASRTVRGPTCDEVVSSIALVVALAIDARATQQKRPSRPVQSPTPSREWREVPPHQNEAPPNRHRTQNRGRDPGEGSCWRVRGEPSEFGDGFDHALAPVVVTRVASTIRENINAALTRKAAPAV